MQSAEREGDGIARFNGPTDDIQILPVGIDIRHQLRIVIFKQRRSVRVGHLLVNQVVVSTARRGSFVRDYFDQILHVLSDGARGCVSFDESLLRLVKDRRVSIDEAFIRAVDRDGQERQQHIVSARL